MNLAGLPSPTTADQQAIRLIQPNTTCLSDPTRMIKCLLVVCTLAAAWGCTDKKASPQAEISISKETTPLILLNQGWDEHAREIAWYTSFGSQILPEPWFMALEQPDSDSPFSDPRFLESFGFDVAGTSPANPHGLPIGFTLSDENNGHRWVGLGCSACHSGPVYYQGKHLHIDGGAAMIDFHRFENAVINGLIATLESKEKFTRFSAKLVATDSSSLRQDMALWLTKLQTRQQVNKTHSQYGFGRLDAFGQIFNAISVVALGIADNRREPDAPVSFPVLWDAAHLDVVQWNASAANTIPGPLLQNATTALAVFGNIDVSPSHPEGYASSIDIENLAVIENTWYTLEAPKWPHEVFPPLNTDLVNAGAEIYRNTCQACHEIVDPSLPKRELKAVKVAVEEVGTDPKMADNFANAQVKSGVFEGQKLLFLVGEKIAATEHPILLAAHATAGALLHHPLETLEQTITSLHQVIPSETDLRARNYKARPLNGIWASAPYLHNGSIPTLQDLLSPEEQRPTHFTVGKVEFDPIKVGLSNSILDKGQISDFNTTLAGNSNRGHRYGVHSSSQERTALLEYLKSL